MKSKICWISLSILFLASLSWAQSDPGQPDTVYFCDNTLYFAQSEEDSTPVAFLRLAFYNDSVVQAITVPLAYALGSATFDSVSYAGSRVDYLLFKTVNFDTLADKVLMGAVPVEEDPINPGRGHLVTLWFTLNSKLASVSFDTTFFPPSNHLYFVNPSGDLYTPYWAGTSNFNAVTFLAGDASDDGLLTLVDVVYLVNYVLKGGPAPVVLASGDVDASCGINLVDVVYLVNYVLKGGPAPLVGCLFPPCN